MGELPAGTVTFLFTDVEGSTRLLHELGDGYADVLAEHRRVLRASFARHGGVEVDTQGDAFFVAFARASDALAAAADARDALQAGPIRVRMGLHTGEPLVTEEGYVGIDVHRAARIAAAGHGGQVLVSQSTRDLARPAALRDLGNHRLKDLSAPERIYQLGETDFPALKSLNQTNLPVQSAPLIGRDRELVRILELLRSNRLVTLTGPGGSGKTRLALQAAADLVEEYPDGVWFVSLAAIRDPDLVGPTITQVLGEGEDLQEALRGKGVLLLLDNLEQLLPAAAPIIASLDAHVLVTSRERVNITTEQEYPVPTLALDDAAALFVQKARQLKPSFEPDEHVIEIARRLDGLPLALELAAARVKVLTPAQIAEHLGHSLHFLTGGALDAPERQRTLRATIEWSYDLLDEQGQQVFARVGVFAGSFDLEAAKALDEVDLDTLGSLVEKSLVQQTEEGRFFLLETIREYALELLTSSGEVDLLRQRHAEYFVALAQRAAPPGRYAAYSHAFEQFDSELVNFRSAFSWLFQNGETEAVLSLGSALSAFWLARSHFHDARRWLDAASFEDRSIADDVRASALHSAGLIAFFVLDDASRAEPLWEGSLMLFQDLGDSERVAALLDRLGVLAHERGDLQRALGLFKDALRLIEETGAHDGEGNTLHHIGEVFRDLEAYDDAERYLERAAQFARGTGDVQHLRHTIHSLGDLALDRGASKHALRLYSESLRMNIELGGKREQIYCIAGIGCALAELGRSELAARLWGSVEAHEQELGFRMLSHERRRYVRRMAAARDRLGEAAFAELYREGAALTREGALEEALAAVD